MYNFKLKITDLLISLRQKAIQSVNLCLFDLDMIMENEWNAIE